MKFGCPNMKKHGFTLIEILVATSVVLLLIGLAIANYIRFNERQKLVQAQEVVRQAVADAQNSARSGKLRGCVVLQAYQIEFDGSQIEITSLCQGSEESDPVRFFDLPSGVEFSGTQIIYARPVSGLIYRDSEWTQTDSTLVIFHRGGVDAGSVEIDHSGAVKQLDLPEVTIAATPTPDETPVSPTSTPTSTPTVTPTNTPVPTSTPLPTPDPESCNPLDQPDCGIGREPYCQDGEWICVDEGTAFE